MPNRTVNVDGESFEVSTDAFTVGEWAAAQDRFGRYIQGLVTRVSAGVVTIKEEGLAATVNGKSQGRQPHYTVPIERVYMRRPPAEKS